MWATTSATSPSKGSRDETANTRINVDSTSASTPKPKCENRDSTTVSGSAMVGKAMALIRLSRLRSTPEQADNDPVSCFQGSTAHRMKMGYGVYCSPRPKMPTTTAQ